ncbi:hypothetical protein SOVF_199850 [Spinacia oleracea]|nr:hypothetical protein SOVF_199850 [Spinacia oleracea]
MKAFSSTSTLLKLAPVFTMGVTRSLNQSNFQRPMSITKFFDPLCHLLRVPQPRALASAASPCSGICRIPATLLSLPNSRVFCSET